MGLARAKQVLIVEAGAINAMAERLDDNFVQALTLVHGCRGRVVVTGMGKAGLVGQKISATLASTGTPSYALHPAEALHGDLGRVVKEDVVLVLSNSGETDEVVRLVPHLRRIGTAIVTLTGKPDSTLAQHADVVIDVGNWGEACPLGLAPSTSTTVMLAVGDALALGVQDMRDFTPEEYARFHPGGSLGRKLLRVSEVMRTGKDSPIIAENHAVTEALFAITSARAGAISVVDDQGRLVGIFTDGDLRRHVAEGVDLKAVALNDVMTRTPRTLQPERLATEAARIMCEHRIDELPVVDEERKPIGMVDVQDLLAVGLV